jgi:hypothetical protein
MIQGHAKAQLFNAEGLGDAPFLEAMRQKRLNEFLKTLPRELCVESDNLIMDMFAAILFRNVWHGQGVPDLANYWNDGVMGGGGISGVYLSTQSSEPSVDEPPAGTAYGGFSANGNACDSTYSGKEFFEGDSEKHQMIVNPDGRESIIFLSRFLWLPSEGNLSTIRSLTIHWSSDADNNLAATRQGKIGRVRFKDGGGNPVTFDKSSTQALLVEYEQEWIAA